MSLKPRFFFEKPPRGKAAAEGEMLERWLDDGGTPANEPAYQEDGVSPKRPS